MPLGLTPAHLILILVIALIVVGPGRLPEVGSALGKSIKEFRKAASDIQESTSTSAAPVPAAAAPAPAPVQAAPAPALVQAAPVAAPVAAPFAPPPPPPAPAAAAPAAEPQPTDPATADESAVSPEVGA